MTTPKNRGLGKGLEALFGEAEIDTKKVSTSAREREMLKEEGIMFVNINDMKPNEQQPRKNFDEGKLNELAISIKEHGVIQPVILRKAQTGYEIVAGERRWRASRMADLKEIPCIVKEFTDEENMLITIIENMQREDLNPIEEAEGLNQMISTYGLTQGEVSKSVGKSRPYITNALRLLKLPEQIRNMVSSEILSAGHARALVGITDEEQQISIAEYAVEKGLSVRDIEKLMREKPRKQRPPHNKKEKSANIKKVEEDLKNTLGTKVNLKQSGKGGKIEIEFYSREELERLIELLKTLT